MNWISSVFIARACRSSQFINAHIHPQCKVGGSQDVSLGEQNFQQNVVIRGVDGKRWFKWQLLQHSKPCQHLQVRLKGPENTDFPFGNQGQDAAVLPQRPHPYHIPTPAELPGIQVLLSLAFMGNAERKEEGSWNACSYLSHHINTVFWHWMWLASKGDGNAALLFGKASLSCSFSGHKKEREENKNSKRKKGNEKERSKTKNIGKREKQRQICFSELLHFSVEPDLLQVGRRCCTTL